ncbi:hypothetical protein [Legionella parisiensis]|nr:hypothetical protein [Legionella parisiensis]KTD44320.1 hypothetical protein Lpar_0406 [Legionella parisiensis]STX71946.1 Uncharacterised protein [Legionella parisiensis]
MQKKYDSTTMDVQKKEKKKVSWVDDKTEGKIEKGNPPHGTGASPRKEIMNQKFKELVSQGYTKIEAAALIGKSSQKVGTTYVHGEEIPKFIFTDPIFYASAEEIEQRKLLREKLATPSSKNVHPKQSSSQDVEIFYPPQSGSKNVEKEANRYSFFSTMSIGVGIAALAVAATIGIVASNK